MQRGPLGRKSKTNASSCWAQQLSVVESWILPLPLPLPLPYKSSAPGWWAGGKRRHCVRTVVGGIRDRTSAVLHLQLSQDRSEAKGEPLAGGICTAMLPLVTGCADFCSSQTPTWSLSNSHSLPRSSQTREGGRCQCSGLRERLSHLLSSHRSPADCAVHQKALLLARTARRSATP